MFQGSRGHKLCSDVTLTRPVRTEKDFELVQWCLLGIECRDEARLERLWNDVASSNEEIALSLEIFEQTKLLSFSNGLEVAMLCES